MVGNVQMVGSLIVVCTGNWRSLVAVCILSGLDSNRSHLKITNAFDKGK